MNRKKYLAKNTALFAINSFATKIIVFILVPIYTNVLSTSEYGVVDLVTTLATIIVPVIIVNINEAVQRFCLDEDADVNAVMSVGISVLLLSCVTGLLIIPISQIVKTIGPYSVLFYIYCVTQGICLVFSSYLRGKEKLNHFAIFNIIITLTGALFNILFLVVLKTGVAGYFWAFILSYIIGAIYVEFAGKIHDVFRNFKIDKDLAQRMLKYSIVLVPNTLMWWIMNASDRIMVIGMIGIAASGIYAVSYKIPSAISSMSTVFNQAWSYSAIKENKSDDRESFNRKMYDTLFGAQVLLTVFLIAVIRDFMRIYVAKSYYDAWKYTIPLLVGYFFMSLGTFFSVQYTVNKDSKGFLFSGMTGAITNIVLNFLLIPAIGTMGAAIATAISYIAVFVFRAKDIQKYLKIKVFDSRKIILVAIMALMAFCSFIESNLIRYSCLLAGLIASIIILWNTINELVGIGVQSIEKHTKRRKEEE